VTARGAVTPRLITQTTADVAPVASAVIVCGLVTASAAHEDTNYRNPSSTLNHMHSILRLATAVAVALVLSPPLSASDDPATADELISAAETQLSQQDIDGAIATLTRAVDADPKSTLAHTRLGGAYLMAQRYDNAIEEFQTSIALDADNAGAFIGLGVAYLHQGRSGQAKAALTEARRLAPDKAAEIDDLISNIERASSAHP